MTVLLRTPGVAQAVTEHQYLSQMCPVTVPFGLLMKCSQKKRIYQLQSTTHSDLQKELAEIRGLIGAQSPQAGTVKDIATTEGAVVQPGSVILTLLPLGEPLFADVAIKNEDISFIQVGRTAQVKLAAYPASQVATYKARIALDQQHRIGLAGQKLQAGAGMQVAAEIHQGRLIVLEYLLSPVTKAAQMAGREK